MNQAALTLIQPALDTQPPGDAELLGSLVWLALHARIKRNLPLASLESWLLPVLTHRQFIIASTPGDNGPRPVAYLSWANLSADIEAAYVANPDRVFRPEEWASGDRMWVIDWVTPFGHSHAFSRALLAGPLASCCFRSLYHRGSSRGLRVMYFRGDAVSKESARHWWTPRPILAVPRNRMSENVHATSVTPIR